MGFGTPPVGLGPVCAKAGTIKQAKAQVSAAIFRISVSYGQRKPPTPGLAQSQDVSRVEDDHAQNDKTDYDAKERQSWVLQRKEAPHRGTKTGPPLSRSGSMGWEPMALASPRAL